MYHIFVYICDPNTLFKFRHFWVEFVILLNLLSLSWIWAASRSMQEWNRVMCTFTVTVNLTDRWFGDGLTLVLPETIIPRTAVPNSKIPRRLHRVLTEEFAFVSKHRFSFSCFRVKTYTCWIICFLVRSACFWPARLHCPQETAMVELVVRFAHYEHYQHIVALVASHRVNLAPGLLFSYLELKSSKSTSLRLSLMTGRAVSSCVRCR